MKTNLYTYIALVIVIILVLYLSITIVVSNSNKQQKEGFLPGFQKMYRPYVRNVRLYTTSGFNSISNKVYVVFKKWGLI